MKNTIYAIGDIHGELELLTQAVAKVERDGGPNARIIFLGDYIDRGPQSRGVIEFLMEGVDAAKNWVCLRGNHDRMFSMFMEDYPRTDIRFLVGYHWLHQRIGGKETLASYGCEVGDSDIVLNVHNNARAVVPKSHIAFLDSLSYSHQVGNLFFVHAGIRPGVPIEKQDKDDLLWIRGEFLEDTRQHPLLIVHGHTPVPDARHFGNRINLDTGCGYGKQLTTAVFEDDDCWLLTDAGRLPLLPNPPT